MTEEAKRTTEGDIVERLLRMVPVDILGGKPMLLNPDGPAAVHEIDQLRNEIINFRTEIKRLRATLEFYADKKNWELWAKTEADGGYRARAVLEGE